jgi:hypothetical protein
MLTSKKAFAKVVKTLVFLPPLFMAFYLLKYGVNVPFFDEWNTPGQAFIQFHQGELDFAALIAQHNESRLFFPRLIFVALSQVFGWNTRHGMLISFLLASISYWNIYRLFTYTTNPRNNLAKWLGILLIGLTIFSFVQRENWLWGIQFITFVPSTVVSSCILIAYSNLNVYFRLLIPAVLCTVATFTYANGMLTWVVVFPILAFSEFANSKSIKKLLGFSTIWGALAVFNIGYYFYDYYKPPYHPSFSYVLEHPTQAVIYFLSFLGLPLGGGMGVTGSAIAGTLFLFFYLLISTICFLGADTFWNFLKRTFGWHTLAFYSLLSALITTVGRVGFGVEQSLSGRYATFATYFYVAIIGLFFVSQPFFENLSSRNRKITIKGLGFNRILIIFSSIYLLLYLNANLPEFRIGYSIKLNRLYGKSCLIFEEQVLDESCIAGWVYPDLGFWKAQFYPLKDLDLLNLESIPTRNMQVLSKISPLPTFPGDISSVQLIETESSANGISEESEASVNSIYVVRGWTVDALDNVYADAVVLAYRDAESQQDIAFKLAALSIPQETLDFSDQVEKNSKTLAWGADFYSSLLPESTCQISAWAFDIESASTIPIGSSFDLCS